MDESQPKQTPIDQPTDKTTDTERTNDIGFSLKGVTEKPKRKYRKGSKYDPIVDAFTAQRRKMVTVSVAGKDANYLRTQLNKRIEARDLGKKIKVSVVNNVAYLEKI